MMRYGLAFELEQELRANRQELERLSIAVEAYRIKAAMYYSLHMRRWDLGEKLRNQLQENDDAIIGEFDGFCYSSRRASAVYRTLGDMFHDGIITREEYNFCNI